MAASASQSLLAQKLNTFVELTRDELDCLADLQARPANVERGKHLTQEGQTGHKVFVLHAGWACSYKLLPDGGRQIISFPIAGDIVGLRSALLRASDHSFIAITDIVVSPVESAHIMRCLRDFPRLGAALLWAASRDEAMVVEHLVSIGRRNAIERTAYFFSELAERLSLIGQVKENEFDCPLSQFVLADALGLTAIHVNRVIRQLRERNLLTVRRGSVVIHDLPALKRLAGYHTTI